MMEKCKQRELLEKMEMQRNLEFYIHKTTFAGMSGVHPFKHVKKPKDLYPLSSDVKHHKPVIIDREQQKLSVDKVKQSTNFKIWQQAR